MKLSIVIAEKKLRIDFTNSKNNWLNLHYNGDNNYAYVNETQIGKFKVLDNIPPYFFCIGSASKSFTNGEINKISSKGTVFDFSADYVLIGTEICLISTSI